MLSFAGVLLTAPTAEYVGWVESHLPPDWLPHFMLPSWPGRRQQALAFPGVRPFEPARVGRMLWPMSGASRFATAYYLATDLEVTAIKAAYGSGPATLSFNDGARPALTAPMYMLPPRPISQIGGAVGLQLLTLVDGRWNWWFRAASISVVGGTTTWSQLFSSVAGALGISLTVDAIPAAYLKPSAELATYYDALPPLLDACCLSTGLRLVAGMDGTYRAMSATAAQAILASNLLLAPHLAGGTMAF